MRAQKVEVYLQAGGSREGCAAGCSGKADGAKVGPAAGGSGFMGGNVERVVATGHIEMDQPGRHATGERLVYTASDGMYVLTGTPTALPKVVDVSRGPSQVLPCDSIGR